MKEWQKELYIYRLSPAPPRKDDLQEYIDLYLAEKDEKYLSWFLHYYEPTLNTTVMGIVQRYSMFGHFLDIKEACVLGILRALEKYNPNCGTPFITYKTRIMWEEFIIISARCAPDSRCRATMNTKICVILCGYMPPTTARMIPTP